jgi:hypothetical protein
MRWREGEMIEQRKNEVAFYWQENGALQKYILNDQFLKNAHDRLCLLKKRIHQSEIEIEHLEPKVQDSPKNLKRLENVKQLMDEIRQDHSNAMIEFVYLINEETRYRPSKMIDMFVPSDRAADMQANLAETYPLWVERHGLTAAHRIRKVQIARLIIGEYWNKALELINSIKLAGS